MLFVIAVMVVLANEPASPKVVYLENMQRFVNDLDLGEHLELTHLCVKRREVCGRELPGKDLLALLESRNDFEVDTGNFKKFHPGALYSMRHGVNPSVHIVKYADETVSVHVDWTAPKKGKKMANFRHAMIDVTWPFIQRRVLLRAGITNQKKLMDQYGLWLQKVNHIRLVESAEVGSR